MIKRSIQHLRKTIKNMSFPSNAIRSFIEGGYTEAIKHPNKSAPSDFQPQKI